MMHLQRPNVCLTIDMNETLEKVKEFARMAHGDQRRKFADEPYIAHPIRVMETCSRHTSDNTVLAAALLHDVLEDTAVTKEELAHFLHSVFDEEKTMRTTELVEELTDIFTKKQYPQWNRRKRKSKEAERMTITSPNAQTIKYADIIDNSLDIKKAENDFARVFLFECRALLKTMNKGNKILYQAAVETVHHCIEEQTSQSGK